MIHRATLAALVAVFAPGLAAAQTPAGGIVGGSVGMSPPLPYAPPGGLIGTTPSGLGNAMAPGSALSPALPQSSIGVAPPIGAATAGAIGDGRVGTLAPGAATIPGVTGTIGTMPTTSGTMATTPTTNPAPQ